jgi:long-chain acyl-CoA synthetase
MNVTNVSTTISYLPYTHAFEQQVETVCIITGCKIGYYQGSPLKLVEDCGLLKPTTFPSVPRLFNKIYGKITAQFKNFSGVKRWLVERAVADKTKMIAEGPIYKHKLFDFLVFNKIKNLLGGKVEQMITGSAPIDGEVLSFLKVCIGAPMTEGYGLSESAGGFMIT